jgi:hypothetical protein
LRENSRLFFGTGLHNGIEIRLERSRQLLVEVQPFLDRVIINLAGVRIHGFEHSLGIEKVRGVHRRGVDFGLEFDDLFIMEAEIVQEMAVDFELVILIQLRTAATDDLLIFIELDHLDIPRILAKITDAQDLGRLAEGENGDDGGVTSKHPW